RSFDALYDVTWSARPPGVGPLTVYDTAVRIGNFLHLQPKTVYLHAGARDGARALGPDLYARTLAKDALPIEMQCLTPDEIEDCLCIFKRRFKAIATRLRR